MMRCYIMLSYVFLKARDIRLNFSRARRGQRGPKPFIELMLPHRGVVLIDGARYMKVTFREKSASAQTETMRTSQRSGAVSLQVCVAELTGDCFHFV